MDLGTFSMSLAVKDIRASRTFYENLGFRVIDDHMDNNWVILQNGDAILGLFQGMFKKNILTFHPNDARAIQRELKGKRVSIKKEADEGGKGPTHLILEDPDGNNILIDEF